MPCDRAAPQPRLPHVLQRHAKHRRRLARIESGKVVPKRELIAEPRRGSIAREASRTNLLSFAPRKNWTCSAALERKPRSRRVSACAFLVTHAD